MKYVVILFLCFLLFGTSTSCDDLNFKFKFIPLVDSFNVNDTIMSRRFKMSNARLKCYMNYDVKAIQSIIPAWTFCVSQANTTGVDACIGRLYNIFGWIVTQSLTHSYHEFTQRISAMNQSEWDNFFFYLPASLPSNFTEAKYISFSPTFYRYFQRVHGQYGYVMGSEGTDLLVIPDVAQTDAYPIISLPAYNSLQVSVVSVTFEISHPAYFLGASTIWPTIPADLTSYGDYLQAARAWYYYLKKYRPSEAEDVPGAFSFVKYSTYLNDTTLNISYEGTRSIGAQTVYSFSIIGSQITDFDVFNPAEKINSSLAPTLAKNSMNYYVGITSLAFSRGMNNDYPYELTIPKSNQTANIPLTTMFVPIISSHSDDRTTTSVYQTVNNSACGVFRLGQLLDVNYANFNEYIGLMSRLELIVFERHQDSPSVVKFGSSYYDPMIGKFRGNAAIPSEFIFLSQSQDAGANGLGTLLAGFTNNLRLPVDAWANWASRPLIHTLCVAVPEYVQGDTDFLIVPKLFSEY